MDQHEITREIPLLNADGDLTEPGYAKKLLPVYRRADIKASPMRIKEWDYYLINNGRFALALTIDDNGYMGLDSISLLNFEEGWEITRNEQDRRHDRHREKLQHLFQKQRLGRAHTDSADEALRSCRLALRQGRAFRRAGGEHGHSNSVQ